MRNSILHARAPGANAGAHTTKAYEICSKVDLPTKEVEHQDNQARANDLATPCSGGKSLTLSNVEAALGLGDPTGATGMAVQNGRKDVPSQ